MRLISYQPQLAPWSSFDRLSSLRDLLDSAFELAGTGTQAAGGRAWAPVLDIYEDAENVTVKLDAAGLKKEDFDISLHDDNITISGERKSESEQRDGESFRSERFFGEFSRTVTLPAAVKSDGVAATYTDGVLTVTLPKAEEAKPRKIEVKVK
ncbi:MAG: Hsp20/alpha crystallin family protein [Terrimicrobiaceae bacterium]|nr:Hsp20/alpha crystallin family protein [Terrimicrobiaceae bacterium]